MAKKKGLIGKLPPGFGQLKKADRDKLRDKPKPKKRTRKQKGRKGG